MSEYERISSGTPIWHADGRGARPEHIAYRESLHATYEGPYTLGKRLAWDGLTSNQPGMVRNDPLRGFDLTMPAGQAQAGSYTTRDIASAAHGHDYKPAYADWKRASSAHPYLILPGRTALWRNVRFDLLNLGAELRGTAGAILQDWVGIEFETMARYGNTAKSEYSGSGFIVLNPNAAFARVANLLALFQKTGAFSRPVRAGIAPLYLMFARVGGFLTTRVLHIDPDVPHELAIHWTHDAQTMTYWLDGEQVMHITQGEWAFPIGLKTGGRVRFHECGFHMDCWQDNGTGGVNVQGDAGNPQRDQVYTIESMSILAV
jgi:hypothetical protein